MNRNFIFLCLFFLCVLNGCDCVRGGLGMATSKDIEKVREELELKAAQQQRLNDSIAATLSLNDTSEMVQPVFEGLEKRYYVIVGSFKQANNTRSLIAFLKEQGYESRTIPLKNGYDMVALVGYDNYSEARREVDEIEQKEVCPYDVWIYDVRKQLHK